MSATRGRRPLVGVLTGGSGGTYLAPTLRSARGRLFPGVLASFGGSKLDAGEMLVRQRGPVPTQAAVVSATAITVTAAQTGPVPTQAAALTVAASTARSVRVTYLVLEVPDPATTLTAAQVGPVPTQAAVITNTPHDRVLTLAQTAPAPTQAASIIYGAPHTVALHQTAPVPTQAASVTYVAPDEIQVESPVVIWHTEPQPLGWRT